MDHDVVVAPESGTEITLDAPACGRIRLRMVAANGVGFQAFLSAREADGLAGQLARAAALARAQIGAN